MPYTKENNFSKFNLDNYILTINVKKSLPNDIEWEETINTMKDFYTAAEINDYKFSIIFDLRLMGILPLKKIRQWGDLFIDYKEKTKNHINCTSVITDSYLIKSTLNIFFSIYTTVRPMRIVNNIEESYEFIKKI